MELVILTLGFILSTLFNENYKCSRQEAVGVSRLELESDRQDKQNLKKERDDLQNLYDKARSNLDLKSPSFDQYKEEANDNLFELREKV